MKPQLIPALIASVFALAACDQAANNAPAPSAPAAASSNASAASQTSEAASAASSANEAASAAASQASATAPKADGSMSTDIRKDNIGGGIFGDCERICGGELWRGRQKALYCPCHCA